jgi:hypothetical protein
MDHKQADAVQLSLGTFFPSVLLSGILWPIEGMPLFLQYLSKVVRWLWSDLSRLS